MQQYDSQRREPEPPILQRESSFLPRAKTQFHSSCLGYAREEGNVRRRIQGSFRPEIWRGGKSPGLFLMGRSPNWAGEDFGQTYNEVFPLFCQSIQVQAIRSTGFGAPEQEKAEDAR